MRWCEGPVTWWKLLMVFVLGFFHCLPWVTDDLHHCGDFLLSQFHGFTCLQENSGLCYCRRGCLAERLPWWEVISLPSMQFLSPPLREYVSDRGCPLLTPSHVVGCKMDVQPVKDVLPPEGGVQLGFDLECWKWTRLNDWNQLHFSDSYVCFLSKSFRGRQSLTLIQFHCAEYYVKYSWLAILIMKSGGPLKCKLEFSSFIVPSPSSYRRNTRAS